MQLELTIEELDLLVDVSALGLGFMGDRDQKARARVLVQKIAKVRDDAKDKEDVPPDDRTTD